MKKSLIEGSSSPAVSTDGHSPGVVDPIEAMREALGGLADACLGVGVGVGGRVMGEAERANLETYRRAIEKSTADAMAEFLAHIDQFGDAALGINPGGLAVLHRGADEYAAIPRLRITRRNNVVVEVGGHVVATALSTHGIRGRGARRAAAEQYIERQSWLDWPPIAQVAAEELTGEPAHDLAEFLRAIDEVAGDAGKA